MVTSWLLSEFNHPSKPLASLSLLLSEAVPVAFTDPRDTTKNIPVDEANSKNIRFAVEHLFSRGDENPDNLLIFYFCGHESRQEMISHCCWQTMALTLLTRWKEPSISGVSDTAWDAVRPASSVTLSMPVVPRPTR